MDRSQKILVGLFGLATLAVVLWTQRGAIRDLASDEAPAHPGPRPPSAEQLARGEQLAQQFCVSCHRLPTPDMQNKDTWRMSLTVMLPFVGLVPPGTGLIKTNGFERALAAGVFPPGPVMSHEDWDLLHAYYLHRAPEALPAPKEPVPAGNQTQFETVIPKAPFDANCIAVRMHPDGGLLASHDVTKKVYRMNRDLTWHSTPLDTRGAPVEMRFTTNGVIGAIIGDFLPSMELNGSLVRWQDGTVQALAAPLHRPTDVLPLDLNANGREDLVVCEYGHFTGKTYWMENTGESYTRHPLLDMAGCLNVASADFNDDKQPDLAILTGQSREAVFLLINQGDNRFEPRMILERQPMWGHSHLEIADFNNDGHPDLLITNGDNGELDPAPPKPFHGVRIHLNDGQGNFTKELFFAQPGATRALARDFDGDGDLDIASIAFFADYTQNPKAGFLFLRQDQPMQFTVHQLPEADRGRWLTMDAGDVDGDGDIDLALGAYNIPQGQIPAATQRAWAPNPTPILILKNKAK